MSQEWQIANQAHLATALAEVKNLLRAHALHVAIITPDPTPEQPAPVPTDAPTTPTPHPLLTTRPAALDTLCTSFQLTPFERHLLLLCAGIELDSTFAPLCVTPNDNRHYPTFSLALATFPDAHWSALTPQRPLRRYRLLEISPNPSLTVAPLRIDERILHYLTGLDLLDDRLAVLTDFLPTPPTLPSSHAAIVNAIITAWSTAPTDDPFPIAQLSAANPADARAIAAAVAAHFQLRPLSLPADTLPTTAADIDAFARLWEREASLSPLLLFLESTDTPTEENRPRTAERFLQRTQGPILFASRDALQSTHRTTHFFEVPIAPRPWNATRPRTPSALDRLAHRIAPAAAWDDLVLPVPQTHTLRQIALHLRHRDTVYDNWGFASRSSRGLGIAALFAGPSGTGKTMAAEILAAELHLDLYRVDLASIISKYIGETEKNLRKLFDAAEETNAILLFDEADALFGKRSDVKDSHDRYANIEVSYLLQRIEAYRGLAILTSNLKSSLDTAFLRRLRFIIQFPFPDVAQRTDIWRKAFPKNTPTSDLDFTKLAKLNIAGGNIRNIALHAAFLAAEEQKPVAMPHLLAAAQSEYAKLERPLTTAEFGGLS